jgi:hypothetical protein
MEKTMRKIILSGFTSLVIVCGAFGADARSSDEEDSPQASAQRNDAPRLHPSPSDANLRAERKPVAGAHPPAPSPAQEDDRARY